MEQLEPQPKNAELENKIDRLQRSIDRLNKIILWTIIITVVLFVLPLIGLLFAIPQFLSSYSGLQ